MGFGLQCIQCAAKRLQCVQWPKTAGTEGGFYHRIHRTGLRPTQNTQKIFISIDDNERENIKKICDEIFGADNFRNTILTRLSTFAPDFNFPQKNN